MVRTTAVNITNLTTSTNFYELVDFTNEATEGIMGVGFIMAMFFILLFTFMRKYEPKESITLSSFLCFIISIFLVYLRLLNPTFLWGFGVITSLGVFWMYKTRGS